MAVLDIHGGRVSRGIHRLFGRHASVVNTFAPVLTAFMSLMCCLGLLAVLPSPAALAAAPGISGRGTDESDLSACERALSLGFGDAERYQSSLPSYLRLFSAVDGQSRWHTAAVECPQRFAEGTVRSALATHAANTLAARTGINGVVSASSTSLDDDLTLHVDASTAAGLSLAEDRAGFAFEILAARHNADATLYKISDQRKSNAQILATAVAQESDPRQKVYAVDSLIANPDETVDPTNGLKASTTAVVEMNCALEQLDAVSAMTGKNSNSTASASSQSGSAASGSSTESTKSSSGSSSSRTDTETHDLTVISELISAHIATALDLGYPALETALLK
ncbi:hypothetical protein JS532_07930 [Bifidobacterium callimiconis]|uniref:hypothetical protein n=1 Tax=Bifidobacterium callimiconis TaxID=2306973 RepID=UPI001BDBDDEE|nr:hypothetical protein [Bifidobacterium callimiconis]MBT1177486.1 hypothetical protein [Bifidobacterium callimiconis]